MSVCEYAVGFWSFSSVMDGPPARCTPSLSWKGLQQAWLDGWFSSHLEAAFLPILYLSLGWRLHHTSGLASLFEFQKYVCPIWPPSTRFCLFWFLQTCVSAARLSVNDAQDHYEMSLFLTVFAKPSFNLQCKTAALSHD